MLLLLLTLCCLALKCAVHFFLNIQALKQDVSDHKPVIDRLNKTGSALLQLVSSEAAEDVQEKLDDANRRVEDVRNGVRERSNSIDAAMQQSADVRKQLNCLVLNSCSVFVCLLFVLQLCMIIDRL